MANNLRAWSTTADLSPPPAALPLGKDFGQRHAHFKPSLYSGSASAEMPRPLCNGQGQAVMSEDAIVGPVVLLDPHRRPAAVAGLVVPTRVDAVDGQPGRLLAHVGEEAFKGLAPFRGHGNALGAVLMKARVARSVAALNHAPPRPICRRAGMAVRRVARNALQAMNVAVKAAAGARLSAGQVAAAHHPFVPARATAKPLRLVVTVVRDTTKNSPSAEPVGGNINKCWHGRIIPCAVNPCKRGLKHG